MSKYVNPDNNNRNVEKSLFITERMCIFLAGAITSIGFFVFGKSTAAQYTDNTYAQYIVAGSLAAISFYATDLAFKTFLEKSIYETFRFGFNWHNELKFEYITVLKFIRWSLLTALVAAFIWADYKSVYVVRDPFADSAKGEAITNKDSIRAAISAELAAERKSIADQAKAAEKAALIAEAKAINTNPALVKLQSNGNGWAKGQLNAKVASATKSHNAAREKLVSALSERTVSDQQYIESRVAEITAENNEKQSKNAAQKAALTSLFTMFGFGTKLVSIVARFFLVISFLIKTKGKNQDIDGDGDVDGHDVTAFAMGK